MSKIYSRKRFILKPFRRNNRKYHNVNEATGGQYKADNLKKNWIAKRKVLKMLLIFSIAILVYSKIMSYISPVFETLCEDKVKSIATIISNQESTKIMNQYQYEQLYTTEKDEAGNLVIIKSNVVPINNMISDLTESIQNRFNEMENSEIKIPLGNLLGSYYFAGIGPYVPAKVRTSGTLDTEVKSEFISQGINQTLHRVYVNFECCVKIVTPVKNFEKKIINQVIIAEHVIVGNIPESYYNLEGLNGTDEALNVIK